MELSIIGLGKVGSCFLAFNISKGNKVVGIEVNQETVDKLVQGTAPNPEYKLQEYLYKYRHNYQVFAPNNFAGNLPKMIFIIVPTPSEENNLFSIKYIERTLEWIVPRIEKGTCIVVMSTVVPGSMPMMKKELEDMLNWNEGIDFYFCYNPMLIALGNTISDFEHPEVIIVGSDSREGGEIVKDYWQNNVTCSLEIKKLNLVEAEITKLAINCMLTLKISFINAIASLASQFKEVSIDKIGEAIFSDPRLGTLVNAGGPYGGVCFPRDNKAMSAVFSIYSKTPLLFTSCDFQNDLVATEIVRIIKEFATKDLSIIGYGYKKDVYTSEGSFSKYLIETLIKNGYDVTVYDPVIKKELDIKWTDNLDEAIESSETVVLVYPMDLARYKGKIKNKIIIDCWRTCKYLEEDNKWIGIGEYHD